MTRLCLALLAGAILLLWVTAIGTAQSVESSKRHSGAVLEGAAPDAAKVHGGAVLEGGALEAAKIHSGVILEAPVGVWASKVHAGVILECPSIPCPKGGGVILRQPLTHW